MASKKLAIIGDLATENGVVKIIKGFSDRTINPVETQRKIDEAKELNPNLKNIKAETLFKNYAVYLEPGPGRKAVPDEEFEELSNKFDWLEPHQELAEGGEIVPNWIGTEYWKKENGRWEKVKIEVGGISVPPDGILPEGLSREQHLEINKQQDADRIATLSPEERTEEVNNQMAALADQAAALGKRYQIQGVPFDSSAWYQEKKSEVEEKYGLTG
jgi:hypothetical protein